MKPTPGSPAGELRHLQTPTKQTVSVKLEDSPCRFQLGVSECVETKTVTTTTRLTRQFPHVFLKDSVPLEHLDTREYPLARQPPPPEVANFSINIAMETDVDDWGIDEAKTVNDTSITVTRTELSNPNTPNTTRPALHGSPSPSPSEAHLRRPRLRSNKGLEPVTSSISENTLPQPKTRSSSLKAVSDKLRRSIAHGSKINTASGNQRDSSRNPLAGSNYLATPNASEMAEAGPSRSPVSRPRNLHLGRSNISAGQSSQDFEAMDSIPDLQDSFEGTVATPPITDADAEPFADDADGVAQRHPRPSLDIVAAQDVSLPSPRLSPTLAASQLHSGELESDDPALSSFPTPVTEQPSWVDDSHITNDASMALVPSGFDTMSSALQRRSQFDRNSPVVVNPNNMLEAFESMQPEMKTYMIYQFLRRCPRPTLRVVANTVNPAFKCDFFSNVALELSYHILSFLDHRDLCRAAQVSKRWRSIIDGNETGWKELFDRDGLKLPPGELKKAILQGWGWQDPVGYDGFERDLSMHQRLTQTEEELIGESGQVQAPKTRASKRKRSMAASIQSASKRRASGHGIGSSSREDRRQTEVRQHKSHGPVSAANAAAMSVPDPQIGLPSLRQLHLFKSLYRRHHMIRESWTNGKIKPSHVAFTAHPRHVITCLQFDEDKIITGSDDTFIHIYDTKTGKLRTKLSGHEGGVWALQYEGNILVSGSTDRSVRVWDIERGICQQVFYGHTSTVRCLQILLPSKVKDPSGVVSVQPEKPLIITGSRDSQLRVWRLPEVGSRRYIQQGVPANETDCPYFIRALTGHTHSVRAIAAHGDTLVSGSYDSHVRVWRISSGECVHTLSGHTQKVYSVVLDHERNRCISGSMDSHVKIWDLTTGSCLYTLEGHTSLVGLLDLRDERLVSAAADSTLRVWDPETGRCRNTLMAHTGAITCFQHDGQKVISGSEKTVKMWDVKTGECMADLLKDLSGVWQVKFDGRRCVAAVQRDALTYVEILDFGAARDGVSPQELGRRILLNEAEVQALIEEEV